MVLFLSYPIVAMRLFVFFRCETFDTGEQVLHADTSISCSSDLYRSFSGYVWLMVVLYVVGVPVLFATALLMHYEAIRQPNIASRTVALAQRRRDASIAHLRFLFDAYESRWFMTEVVELLRKVLLTGALVLLSPADEIGTFSLQSLSRGGVRGSALQSVVAMLIVVAFLIVYSATGPLVDGTDDMVLVASLSQLFLVLLVGLLIKVEPVRAEFVDRFGSSVFSVLVFLILGSALALLIFGEAIELWRYGQRGRRQQLRACLLCCCRRHCLTGPRIVRRRSRTIVPLQLSRG